MDKRSTEIEKDSNSFQKQIQNQDTQNKIEDLHKNLRKARNEANQLRANYAKLQKDYGDLDSKLYQIEEECNEKTIIIKKSKDQIQSLNEVLSIRNDEYDQLYKTWTETDSANQHLRSELRKWKIPSYTKIDRLQTADLEKKNQKLQKENDQLKKENQLRNTEIDNLNKEWEMKVNVLNKTNDLRLAEIKRLQKSIDSINEQNADDNSQDELDFIKLSKLLRDSLQAKEIEIENLKKVNAEFVKKEIEELVKKINQLKTKREKRKEEYKKTIERYKTEVRDLKTKLKEKEESESLVSTVESINNLESQIIEIGNSCKKRSAKIEAEFEFHKSDFEDWINIFKTYQDRTEKLEAEIKYVGSLFAQVGKCLKEDKKD